MPFIVSGLASIWLYNNIEYFKNISPIEIAVLAILSSIAMGFSLIPTSFVALVSGYFWGLNSIFILIITYIFATFIGYNLSKKIDNDQILNEINKNKKAKAILENLKTDQFKIIVLARLSPIFPFGISNVVFTYLGVPLQKLILAGIIGMLPRTIFLIWAASKAESVKIIFNNSWNDYLKSPILVIGLLSTGFLFYVIWKKIKK
jgi:uncharacterized membrane protein YdjX (TVP38/TMEM64 family)